MESSLLTLSIGVIDEDPNQPRTAFDDDALRELAATIRERGVKTPISVRPNPDMSGRYIINHGARRFRASILAGKEAIPAHVDAGYTEEDQLIENVQRENLSPREVAEFIGKLLARGRKKGEIAKIIGKSPAYVTQHVTLLDLPPPVGTVFEQDRCGDVTVINELTKLYKTHPVQTAQWIGDKMQEINRSTIKLFKDFLDESGAQASNEQPDGKPRMQKKTRLQPHEANFVLHVEIEGIGHARLILDRFSDSPDHVFVETSYGERLEAHINAIKLITLTQIKQPTAE